MVEPHDLQDQAQRAIYEHVTDPMVLVAEGRPRDERTVRGPGSGTLLQTPGGTVVLLTAAHVLMTETPGDGFTLASSRHGGVQDAVVSIEKHPGAHAKDRADEVDVALGLLSDEAIKAFGAQALPTTSVAADAGEVSDEDAVVLCGHPSDYTSQALDHSRKIVWQEFPCLAYFTFVEGVDARGRYKVNWGSAVADNPDERLGRFGIQKGRPFALKHPRGISGGPLWRFSPTPPGRLWSPANTGRIIGIAESVAGTTEFCPSVRMWGEWFAETIARLDAT